ncbi:MAG: LptA/OstA family protein [Bacteroidota bacterium]
MNHFWGWLLLIFCIALGSASAAEEVRVTGKSVWGDTDTEINYLEGDVRFVQGSTVITTEKARVDTDRKTAVFEKKVKLTHPEVTIESDTLEYDLKKEVGTFKTNVVMERKKTKAAKDKAAKDPFKLLTDELFFETETKNFIAKNGRIEHKDFTGEADLIEYNDQLQELLLKENAKLIRPKGETIQGKQIKINVSEKSFKVTDLVSVEFEVEEESD